MNIDINNNNIILRNNYMDNIPNNNDHIINKLNLNRNLNFHSNESNINIQENKTIENENNNNNIINKNKQIPLKGHRTLIINNKSQEKITQNYSKIRDILNKNKFYKPNKNPFINSHISLFKRKIYKKHSCNNKHKHYKVLNKNSNNSNTLNTNDFSNKFIANIITNIPLNYYEAINYKDHLEWEKAINVELNNLYNNKIFSFVIFVPKKI